ncbi:MAG TPA: ABC transporter permease subunit [Candidatus Polarisedimenticolia bacterium]|nr:ABC transporter permease subunit [Candidatus Polarisedimenticolia bacterium]
MKKALIVLDKEWLELRLQRGLLLATLFLPPVMTAFAVVVFYAAGKFSANVNTAGAPLPPEFAGLPPLELAQALVGRQFSVLFLLLPIFIPSVLASYAIVGEKRERTLEPVLATPIRTWELLLGKMLAALIPALAITLGAAALFVIGIFAFAITDRVRELIVTPGWVLAVIVDTPLLALIGVALIVVLSSRVNDPRTAQQFSAVLVVPVLALLFGQLAGVIVLGPALALGIGVILAMVAAGALWVATRLFQREVILTRWR